VTEGQPIVQFSERSAAARAFRDLAKEYVTEFEAEAEADQPVPTSAKPKRGLGAALRGRGA
jgi:MinD-like ATPase involved in chromosome partitioning or flagellar assembly